MNIHSIGFNFFYLGLSVLNMPELRTCKLGVCAHHVCAFKNCACACTMEIIYISNLVIGKHQSTNYTTYRSKQNNYHLKP